MRYGSDPFVLNADPDLSIIKFKLFKNTKLKYESMSAGGPSRREKCLDALCNVQYDLSRNILDKKLFTLDPDFLSGPNHHN
jgi:hypothetical protein